MRQEIRTAAHRFIWQTASESLHGTMSKKNQRSIKKPVSHEVLSSSSTSPHTGLPVRDGKYDPLSSREGSMDLTELARHIEIAKKEWEKTMDCVDDMIILTDGDGIIKRVNRAVRKFAGQAYEDILGKTWEDVIIDSDLEAVTLQAGSTGLFHKPTGRWFELHAYPFEDPALQFSGTVLTIHETTDMKNFREKLEKANLQLEKNRRKLQSALENICSLMEKVIRLQDSNVRFSNPNIRKCYEVKGCTKTSCPCHGKEPVRCWQVAGTFCGGTVQGTFAQKYNSCVECEVYKKATADPIYQVGEHFNNMMHILSIRNGREKK